MTLLAQLQRKADVWAQIMANEWEGELRRTAPTKTGRMRNATTSQAAGNTATVTVDTDYAHMVAYGARPHVIEARPGGMLAFPGRDGQTIYRRSVNHPGIARPNPWWTNAIDRVPEMAQRAWNSIP